MMGCVEMNDVEKMKRFVKDKFSCLNNLNKKACQKIKMGCILQEISNILDTLPQIIYIPFDDKKDPTFHTKTYEQLNDMDNILMVATIYNRTDVIGYLLNFISEKKLHIFNIESNIVNNFCYAVEYNMTKMVCKYLSYKFIRDMLKKHGEDILIISIECNAIECFKELIMKHFITTDQEFTNIVNEIYEYDAYEMREILETYYKIDLA